MKQIVAAETAGNDLLLFFHADKSFRVEKLPFSPFVLLANDPIPPENCRICKLGGSGIFNRQAFFDDAGDYEQQSAGLKKSPGVMFFRDKLQQALSISGIRLFEDIGFNDLRKIYFSVTPAEDGGSISALSIADSSGYNAELKNDEENIIRTFAGCIADIDPDMIIGFDCCRNDLPLLIKRAKKYKIELPCGRDGSPFSTRQSRYSAGEKQFSYKRFDLHGRHVVDMMHAVQLYDASHRDMEDTDMASVAEYFNINCSSKAEFIAKLSDILLPSYFYRTRVLPLGFQESILRGSGSALDALMTAKYLEKHLAIPAPEPARQYSGALSAMAEAGLFRNVTHCDVRSLYPSLLLHFKRSPSRDDAEIFLSLLENLREFRLNAKDKAKLLPPGKEKMQLDAMQSSFKILINSFYGYLGFSQGSFNDYDLAEKITSAGRELLGKLIALLETNGAKVIEMDTDGIYFQSPDNNTDIRTILKESLPQGIELEFDDDFPAMYSHKAKNYALLTSEGEIKLTGAALKSRAMEGFQRKFIFEAIKAKLLGKQELLPQIYQDFREKIINHSMPIEEFAKSEILSDSPENYRKKLNNGSARRSAAYELVLDSGKIFRAGDKIRFYVTGNKAKLPVVGNCRLLDDADVNTRDENVPYYLAKLDAAAEIFAMTAK